VYFHMENVNYSMKTITFRPLRFVRKTGKIVVASYAQWYRVKTADYNKFNLIIDDAYKTFAGDSNVFDHTGEHLFWRDFNPSDITIFDCGALSVNEMRAINPRYAIQWNSAGGISYSVLGLDCQGTPTFSHGTIENIMNGNADVRPYELLTVDMVRKWFGWFLYNLENSSIARK
jgi:hypothetical protein